MTPRTMFSPGGQSARLTFVARSMPAAFASNPLYDCAPALAAARTAIANTASGNRLFTSCVRSCSSFEFFVRVLSSVLRSSFFVLSSSERPIREHDGPPHVRHGAIVVAQTFFGLLEVAADD